MIVIKNNITNSTLIEVETDDEAYNMIKVLEEIDRSEGIFVPDEYYIEVL